MCVRCGVCVCVLDVCCAPFFGCQSRGGGKRRRVPLSCESAHVRPPSITPGSRQCHQRLGLRLLFTLTPTLTTNLQPIHQRGHTNEGLASYEQWQWHPTYIPAYLPAQTLPGRLRSITTASSSIAHLKAPTLMPRYRHDSPGSATPRQTRELREMEDDDDAWHSRGMHTDAGYNEEGGGEGEGDVEGEGVWEVKVRRRSSTLQTGRGTWPVSYTVRECSSTDASIHPLLGNPGRELSQKDIQDRVGGDQPRDWKGVVTYMGEWYNLPACPSSVEAAPCLTADLPDLA